MGGLPKLVIRPVDEDVSKQYDGAGAKKNQLDYFANPYEGKQKVKRNIYKV